MIETFVAFLSDRLLVIAVLGFGTVLTFRSGLLQLRHFFPMFGVLRRSFAHDAGRLSSFQALMMSLAGRVGSGNISGVAVAVVAGGPGAVFWMWVAGLIGMASSFLECTLAQVFKIAMPDGTYRGGPAYYIERGLSLRWLSIIFSVLLVLHAGFLMTAFQSFTTATSVAEAFNVPVAISGPVIVLVLGLVVFGGVRRIASAADLIVPFMVMGYLAVAVFVVATNIERVPEILSAIISGAFGFDQLAGGAMGAAIVNGTKRGLFSNEAGLGTAPNVAAIAQAKHPAAQGLLQALSVFIDTTIVCTSTAAIILFSDAYGSTSALNGVLLTQSALAEQVGEWGRPFVSSAIVLFAFTSLMYSYYLAENCLTHLGAGGKTPILLFRMISLAVVYWGTRQNLATIFTLADLMMACLAGVNIYALVRMSGLGLRLLKDYESQRRAGIIEPVFDPSEFSDVRIAAEAWPKGQ